MQRRHGREADAYQKLKVRHVHPIPHFPILSTIAKEHGHITETPGAAVIAPDCREMCDALVEGLKLEAKLEIQKNYSRDWMTPGRVRVIYKDAAGNAVRPDIPNKQVLIAKCAELCARHPQRQERLAEMKRFEETMCSVRGPGGASSSKTSAKSATASQAAPSKGNGKSNKKKGKKK